MPGLYRRKDSPYWWYWWHDGPRQKARSTRCTSQRAARKWIESLALEGAPPTRREARRPFEVAAEAYVKLRTGQGRRDTSYRALETDWAKVFRGRLLHSIEPREVSAALERLATDRKWSASSRNTALGQLSGLFVWAIRRGYCDDNPCRRVERLQLRNQRSTWLSPGQVAALAQAGPPAYPEWAPVWSALIVLAASTGIRQGKLLDLRRDDFAVDSASRGYLVIERDKSGHPTVKLLAGRVLEIVNGLVRAAPTGESLLIPGPRGGNAHSTLRRWLPEACKLAEIPHGRGRRGGMVFHDLRRTMASTALSLNVNQRVVQAMGSWRDPKMLDRYAVLADSQLHAAEALVAETLTSLLRRDEPSS